MKLKQKNNTEIPREEIGYVYFIGEIIKNKWDKVVPEYIKVGWTLGEPEKRLKALQTSNPRQLFLLGAIKTNKEAEKTIHYFLEDARAMGEWFVFKEIKERLVMWIPIFSFYDFDEDCLDVKHFYLREGNSENKKFKKKTLCNLTDEELTIFKNFPYTIGSGYYKNLLKPTQANKLHIDIIGSLINVGDIYYLIDDYVNDYSNKTKISKSSLSIFKYFLEKFKLYKSFKHISKKHSKSILDYNKVTSEITDKFIKEYDLL
tara:strand:- start:161 stop:940 length:780 start_codon:yes stop_codon:yes gene_type:complete